METMGSCFFKGLVLVDEWEEVGLVGEVEVEGEGEEREETRIASRIVIPNSGRGGFVPVPEPEWVESEGIGFLEASVERSRLRSSNSSNEEGEGGVGSESSSSEVRERKVEATEPGD